MILLLLSRFFAAFLRQSTCQNSSACKANHGAEFSYLSRARSGVLISIGVVILCIVSGEEVVWISEMKVGYKVEYFSRSLAIKMSATKTEIDWKNRQNRSLRRGHGNTSLVRCRWLCAKLVCGTVPGVSETSRKERKISTRCDWID
jgi:hypothetical protein